MTVLVLGTQVNELTWGKVFWAHYETVKEGPEQTFPRSILQSRA